MDLTQLFSNDELVAKVNARLANIDSDIAATNEQFETAVREAEERRNAALSGLEETRVLLEAKRFELTPGPVVEEAVAEVQ